MDRGRLSSLSVSLRLSLSHPVQIFRPSPFLSGCPCPAVAAAVSFPCLSPSVLAGIGESYAAGCFDAGKLQPAGRLHGIGRGCMFPAGFLVSRRCDHTETTERRPRAWFPAAFLCERRIITIMRSSFFTFWGKCIKNPAFFACRLSLSVNWRQYRPRLHLIPGGGKSARSRRRGYLRKHPKNKRGRFGGSPR